MLAHYLLELALQEYEMLKYLPSVVATCCLSMAMYTIDGFPMVRAFFHDLTILSRLLFFSFLIVLDKRVSGCYGVSMG